MIFAVGWNAQAREGGRFVDAAELYPRSEAWGTDGFTLTDRDAAFAKLRELA